MMPKIFISYRRKDSLLHAGRIFDQLALRFDPKDIFMDFTIPTGGDFPQILQNAVTSCDVCLVIIGMNWENIIYQRTQENADDWVRYEVNMALQRHTDKKCVVMPILVGGATMPDIKRLPDEIHKLNDLNARNVRDEQEDFHNDMAKLATLIQQALENVASQSHNHPQPVPQSPIDIHATFEVYETARDNKQWHEAKRLANMMQNTPELAEYATYADILAYDKGEIDAGIQAQIEAEKQQELAKKRFKEYELLRRLVTGDKKRFRASFDAFSRTYPHYDPDPLGHFASRAYDLLPQPFEWVPIPAGKVTLITEKNWQENYVPKGEGTVFDVPAFTIGKYPVTNAQYEVFVKHPDGYKNPKWWDYSDEAKQWRAGRPEMNPSEFDGGDCPRETVSWYDSVAFCLWLSAMTGDNISLPTEQQWQRAAIGDTQNVYPWGDKIDETYANYRYNVGRTTPVTQYPKGASPYGVMDMSGNVWEWCVTAYESGDIKLIRNNARVLRGGSWLGTDGYVRSANRNGNAPSDEVGNNYGFRCLRSHLLF